MFENNNYEIWNLPYNNRKVICIENYGTYEVER